LTLSSAPSLPSVFQNGPAHGVVPYRALILSRSRTSSPMPHALLPLAPLATRGRKRRCRRSFLGTSASSTANSPSTPSGPSTSGPYSTRESALPWRRFRPPRARSSHGLRSPPGFCPSWWLARPSPRLPSRSCGLHLAVLEHTLPQGFAPPGDGGSQANRGPSWGFSTS